MQQKQLHPRNDIKKVRDLVVAVHEGIKSQKITEIEDVIP